MKLMEVISSRFIRPAVLEIANETGQGFSVKSFVIANGQAIADEMIVVPSPAGTGSPMANGEIRVLLGNVKDARTTFAIEAIFKGLSPESGFSGFSARGKVDVSGDLKVTARTNRYNVWDWGRDFSM